MLQKRTIPKHIQRLAKSIKKSRKAKGMTQEELAEKVNVSLGWISRIERGVNSPNLKLLKKIARVLDIKVRDLIPY